jgi:hypothetical protein
MTHEEYIRKISQIIKSWNQDTDNETFKYICESFMNAKTTHEVTEIILSNLQFIDRMGLWSLANKAKRRINNLNKVRRELTDIIYLN